MGQMLRFAQHDTVRNMSHSEPEGDEESINFLLLDVSLRST